MKAILIPFPDVAKKNVGALHPATNLDDASMLRHIADKCAKLTIEVSAAMPPATPQAKMQAGKPENTVASQTPAAFWMALISAAFLFVATLPELPYGYFILLRFMVCGTCVFLYTQMAGRKPEWVGLTHGGLALLFNPIIKIHLGRDAWAVVDVVTGIFMVFTIVVIRRMNRV
ncbi:MAG: DUF6804 family protein [Roseimicrobium sp.]